MYSMLRCFATTARYRLGLGRFSRSDLRAQRQVPNCPRGERQQPSADWVKKQRELLSFFVLDDSIISLLPPKRSHLGLRQSTVTLSGSHGD